MHWRRWFIFKV